MRGWRTKLVFLLIVYFAGFATAIYCLAPAPEGRYLEDGEMGFGYSILKSDEFARSFNEGMHKCIDFGRTAARGAGELIRAKYEQKRLQEDG
jgi:hypothetical protein